MSGWSLTGLGEEVGYAFFVVATVAMLPYTMAVTIDPVS